MKITNKLLLLLFVLNTAISCSVDEPKAFDKESSYIYFNMPFVYNYYGNKTDVRYDSLIYSFAFENHTVDDYTFEVPIGVMGVRKNQDRTFKVEVVNEKTTAISSDWDASSIQNGVVKKDELFTTLKVKINRTESLRNGSKYIFLRVVSNENFDEGDKKLLEVKLVFSDILKEPSWWNRYVKHFGPFQKEIFIKWIEIYPLGSDHTINYDNYKPLYWDNMPVNYYASWYPVLALKMNILKQYFIENEVYPDGDTSKPRILLPN